MDERDVFLILWVGVAVATIVVWVLLQRHTNSVLNDKEDDVPRRLPITWPSFSRRRYERLSTEEKKAWWRRQNFVGTYVIWPLFFAAAAVGLVTQNILLVLPFVPVLWAAFFYSQLGGRLPRNET
jgi:hypothetical protein